MKSSDKKPMNCISDVLSILMSECDIDDSTLSRETGIPASTISRIRINSEANPTASTLRPLANFFSISINQLIGDEPLDNNRLPGKHTLSNFTNSRLPIIDWDIVIDWIDNNTSSLTGKLMKWISTEKEVGDRCFALPIITNSFGLSFRKGSIIMIDPNQVPIDGDIVVLKKSENHSISLKQLIIDSDEQYIKSLNPEIKNTKLLTPDEEIIGVIFEARYSLTKEKAQQQDHKNSNVFQSILVSTLKKI
jgi:SOS-response transcriptional repressor LexA